MHYGNSDALHNIVARRKKLINIMELGTIL